MAKPGNPQSGKSAGSAPPFATKAGRPTNTQGAGKGASVPQNPPGGGGDRGGPGWDIDQEQTPQGPRGGTVLKADPTPASVNIGAVGNGAAPPFKNLK